MLASYKIPAPFKCQQCFVEAGNTEVVAELLQTGHIDDVNDTRCLDEQDDIGNTPLHMACSGGHEDTVRLLVSHFANARIENDYGQTPTKTAILNGFTHLVPILNYRMSERDEFFVLPDLE